MSEARLHPDLIFFLIAAGWVAIKFFSALKEQKAKDRERATAEKHAASAPRPLPHVPKRAAVMKAKVREMETETPYHATVAEVQRAEMPALPTGQIADGHMPPAVPTSADPVPGAEKAQARSFKLIPRSRSTALRRRIVIDVRHPASLRQAIVLSEVLGRPRAFDV